MKVEVVDKTNGSKFDIEHPEVKDIESAKVFLIDYIPFFTVKTNWDEYELKLIMEKAI